MSTITTEVITNGVERVNGVEERNGFQEKNGVKETNGAENTTGAEKGNGIEEMSGTEQPNGGEPTNQVEAANVMPDQGLPPSKYLCLTILGYRKPGMSEEAFRRHMIEVSAPLTKDLMAKHGIKRWTVTHNPKRTRDLMSELYDRQMANVADYDVFSQVVFESLEHYKNLKSDPWYKARLFGDHEKFADTDRSMMTMGWIEEWVNDGKIRENMADPWVSMLT